MRFFVRDGKRSAKKAFLIVMSIMALVVQPLYGVVASQVANAAAPITVCASGCDYTTIQDGVNAASGGDIVSVGDGTYNETVSIKKNITLQSVNGAAHTTIVAQSPLKRAIDLPSAPILSSVTIDGFTLNGVTGGVALQTNSNSAAGYEHTGLTYKNLVINANGGAGIGLFDAKDVAIDNVTIDGANLGVEAIGVANLTMSDSTITKSTTTGFNVWKTTGYEANNNLALTSNTFTGNKIGVKIADTSNVTITGGSVSGGSYGISTQGSSTVVDGVSFHDIVPGGYLGFGVLGQGGTAYGGQGIASGSYGANTLTVKNSTFANIGRTGVLFNGSASTGVFNNNTYTGKGTVNGLDYGVVLWSGAQATITGNTIKNNQGVASDGSGSSAIAVWDAGSVATITNNTLANNTAAIVGVYGSATTAKHNDIVDNTYGVYTQTSDATIVATENWWGDATGPSGDGTGTGDSVEDATFDPWLCQSFTSGSTLSQGGICDTVAPDISWQLQPNAIYGAGQGFHVRPITSEVGTIKSIYFDSVSPANLIWTLDSNHKNFDTTNASNQALWDGLADGTHKFVAVFEDYAGNSTTSSSNNFVIDRTAPTAYIKGNANAYTPASVGDHTAGIYKKISYKLFDSKKIDKVTINGVTKNLTDNNWSDVDNIVPGLYGAVEGSNTMVVYDVAGNTTTYIFILDTIVPEVDLTAPTGVTNENTVEVKGWANDANFDYYACYITTNQPITAFGYNWTAGQEPKNGPANDQSLTDRACNTTRAAAGSNGNAVTLGHFDVSGLPDGDYTIHMHAHDLAGNQNEATTVFTIDRTAPVVTVSAITNSTNTTPTISGTTSEKGGDVTITIDGIAVATVTSDADGNWSYVPTTALSVAAHTVIATATDAAGNTSSSDTSTSRPYWTTFSVLAAVVNNPSNGSQGTSTPVTQSTPATNQSVNTVLNRSAASNVATTDGTDATDVDTTDDSEVLAATDDNSNADNDSDQQVLAAEDTKKRQLVSC